MQIWLKQDKVMFRLPVLPAGFNISVNQNNTTVDINALGEINLLGKKGLKKIGFSSFFPSKFYGFEQYTTYQKPYVYIKRLESWMSKPVQLIITGTNVNMTVTLEYFSYAEKDGTGDVYFDVEFMEYRKPKTATEKVVPGTNSTTIVPAVTLRLPKQVQTTTYTAKAGDTLPSIAKKLTGNASNAVVIANQNGIKNMAMLNQYQQAGKVLVMKV